MVLLNTETIPKSPEQSSPFIRAIDLIDEVALLQLGLRQGRQIPGLTAKLNEYGATHLTDRQGQLTVLRLSPSPSNGGQHVEVECYSRNPVTGRKQEDYLSVGTHPGFKQLAFHMLEAKDHPDCYLLIGEQPSPDELGQSFIAKLGGWIDQLYVPPPRRSWFGRVLARALPGI